MLCATLRGSSQTCYFVQAVAYITMLHVWKLVPHPFSVQAGNVLSVKCARHADNRVKTPKCWSVMLVIRVTTHFVFSQLWILFPLTHGNADDVGFALSVGFVE